MNCLSGVERTVIRLCEQRSTTDCFSLSLVELITLLGRPVSGLRTTILITARAMGVVQAGSIHSMI